MVQDNIWYNEKVHTPTQTTSQSHVVDMIDQPTQMSVERGSRDIDHPFALFLF